MSAKFCPECGYKLGENNKFCPECGFKLGENEKKAEPLFDFSEDTAVYEDAAFDGFDEMLKKQRQAETKQCKAEEAARKKAESPIAKTAKPVSKEKGFDVVLTSVGSASVVLLVKAVQNITGFGLVDAKRAVDNTPTTLKTVPSKAVAEDMIKQLTALGAKAVLK